MDAAYNSLKKTVLFVAAIALLLAAPIYATTPSIVINPSFTNNTIQISNASCNDFQILNLTSTGAQIQVQVSVAYNNPNSNGLDPVNGNWLYALVAGVGTTAPGNGSTHITFNVTIPDITTTAGPAGVNLQIGLNSTFSSVTEQAKVNLTVVDSSGAANVPITVNYVYNSSCGGGTGSATNNVITITPGTLTMTAAQGSSQKLPLLIQNDTGNSITFNAITPVGDTWLASDTTSTTSLGPGAAATVNITASAGSLAVNTYNSNITVNSSPGTSILIPVTFAVTNGSGGGTGGGGTGTLTLDGGALATRSFNFIASGSSATGIPGPSCITIADSNSAITNYSDSFTESSGGSWLTVNNSPFSPQSNQSFSGQCLQVQPNSTVNSLTTGVYTAVLTVTDSAGSSATANITLYVTSGSTPGISVNPGMIFNFPAVSTGTVQTESQQFTITGNTGIQLGTAAANAPPAWFSMTTPTGVGTATEQFTITANPTGLTAGIYSTTITIPSSNPAGSTTILVTLSVGQSSGGGTGGGTTTSTVVPTSLAFAAEIGNTAWSGGSEAQSITVTGAAGTQWSSTVSYGAGGVQWLRFGGSSGITGGTFGSTPATLLVDIQPSGLAASSTPYTATITVVTPSGNTLVNVSLLVTASGNHVLLASPASATFTANGTTPSPMQVVFSDTNQGFPGTPGQANPAVGVTTTTTWLTATSVGNTMTLTVNPTGLSTGAYQGSVSVTAAYPNSPLTYPVVLIVNGGVSSGPLTFSTSGMTFNAIANGSTPVSQTLNVTASTTVGASVATSEQSCSNSTWLSISPSGTFNASPTAFPFTVSVNQSGIAASTTCTGTITFTSGSSTQTVSVSMVVAASGTGGNITVTPAGPLSFSYTVGGTTPATQTLSIANTNSGTSPISFTVTSSASWLTTNVNSASTPYSLVVTANPAGLAASSTPYSGTLTITPSGGTAVTVNVTFTIAGLPVVSATPTTMQFSYSVGGNLPPTQTIQVSGGGAAATFTATPSSSGWLKLSATSGTTPNTGTFNITVTADPTGLNAGVTYNGSVTVSGTGTATGSTIVNVTFAVSAPNPTITKVSNGASFISGAVSPGEVISLFANASNPIGPATAVQLSGANCPSPCTNLPTTMGGVQVEFLPNGVFAPLIYVSATQVNAVVPYEVQGVANLQVEVKFLGQASNAFLLQTASTAPGLFTLLGNGSGLAALAQYDASGNYQGINSPSNPASPGWYLSMYVTGEGPIPGGVTGKVTSGTVLPIFGPPTVLIDSLPATVNYYAEAIGIVEGIMQVNVQIPNGIRTAQADTISLSIGGNATQAGVTVQIK